jgi:cold shock CspA family protein
MPTSERWRPRRCASRTAGLPLFRKEISMPTGFLKAYVVNRGFGFIRPSEGGKDIFFHLRDLGVDQHELRTGDQLQFDLATGRDGRPHAVRVRWST